MKDMAATMSGPARLFLPRPYYGCDEIELVLLHRLAGNLYSAETVVSCSGAWFKLINQGPARGRHDTSIKMLPPPVTVCRLDTLFFLSHSPYVCPPYI